MVNGNPSSLSCLVTSASGREVALRTCPTKLLVPILRCSLLAGSGHRWGELGGREGHLPPQSGRRPTAATGPVPCLLISAETEPGLSLDETQHPGKFTRFKLGKLTKLDSLGRKG